jgi:hypothetical protein
LKHCLCVGWGCYWSWLGLSFHYIENSDYIQMPQLLMLCYLSSLYFLIISLNSITHKDSPLLSLSSCKLLTSQLYSTSIFVTCLLLKECFIPFKVLLDKDHSTSKFWVDLVSEFAQKKRCCAENLFTWSLCSRNAKILSCKA